MTRSSACLIVWLLWTGIYLPGIGSLDLKGEEPRRALPAIHMLRSGDWLVPRVGAEPYLRKPPLLNWLIAVSFRLGGIHEWTARLPSALAVLALGLVVAIRGVGWLGPSGALLAAIFCLTNLALMETGRLAELEAVYCSLTGIAFILWMAAWLNQASPWRLWTAPAAFLALGMLEKGPAHLFCFYAVVLGTLARAGEWRALRQPAHFAAIGLILGSFVAWAVPCARAVADETSQNVWAVWARQIFSHSATTHFHPRDWVQNIPRGLAALLPWAVLLPLLCRRGLAARLRTTPREAALLDGARIGSLSIFLLISLLPATSPRYVYPLVGIPCLLLARVLTARRNEGIVPTWLPLAWHSVNLVLLTVTGLVALAAAFSSAGPHGVAAAVVLLLTSVGMVAHLCCSTSWSAVRPGIASGIGMVLITCLYAVAVIPRIAAANTRGARQIAAEIRQGLPAHAVLWILETSYRPFWYYLEPSVAYFADFAQVPSDARYFLLPDANTGTVSSSDILARSGDNPPVLLRQVSARNEWFSVLTRDPVHQE